MTTPSFGRLVVRSWPALLGAALIGALASDVLAQEPAAAAAPAPAPDPTPAEAAIANAAALKPKDDGPEKVVVGLYLNDIQSLDLKTHTYAMDFYIWFRWHDPELNPAASMEFVNPSDLWGHINKPNYETPIELPDGHRYQAIRVQGRFSRKLPLYNYPFDKQILTVEFEDSVSESTLMQYVADDPAVTINPTLVLPGYRIGTPHLELSVHSYPTTFGDPRQNAQNSFTRGRLVVPIVRPAMTYSIKLLLPVLCVILCAALMFILKPSYVDSRVGIGITSLLTIVALQITLNEDLPDVDYLVLMDKIYIASYLFVIIGLGVVVRTARLLDNEGLDAAAALQRKSLLALLSLYFVYTGITLLLAVLNG